MMDANVDIKKSQLDPEQRQIVTPVNEDTIGENPIHQSIQDRRKYMIEYQREYRKRQRNQMNDIEWENKHIKHNQEDRQRNVRRKTERMIQELKDQNNNLTNTSRVELDCNESSGVESLIPQQNDTNYCDVQTQDNVNTNFVNSYQNLQLLFWHHLDSLVQPSMFYMCQECYLGIKVRRTEEGPICSRCQQEKENNRFSAENNMDLGSQPSDLPI